MTTENLLKHFEEEIEKSEPKSDERRLAYAVWDRLMSLESLQDSVAQANLIIKTQRAEIEKLEIKNTGQHNELESLDQYCNTLKYQLYGSED